MCEILWEQWSHTVLSLWVCPSVAPSACWSAALDASAPPPAGCSADADECTGERGWKLKRGNDSWMCVHATHFGLFTFQHVLKPGHVLIHLIKLLLRDKGLLFLPPRMTSTHSFHFYPLWMHLLAVCAPPCQQPRRRCETVHSEGGGWYPWAGRGLQHKSGHI